jgi:prepilin-type N-terminal cleavage/methylation domain-containing protein
VSARGNHPTGNKPAPRAAFSLIEVVAATLIVGIVMVAALDTLGAYIRGKQRVAVHSRASLLAQDLMSEILDRHYDEPDDPPLFGREAAESASDRSLYDDVDDYNGWSSSPPEYKDGTPMAALGDWERRVSVQRIDADDLTTAVASDEGLLRITVEVIHEGDTIVSLTAIRARAWKEPPFD